MSFNREEYLKDLEYEKAKEVLEYRLENLSIQEKCEVWNAYCEENKLFKRVYEMENIDAVLKGEPASYILQSCKLVNYCEHDFLYECGEEDCFESCKEYGETPIDLKAVAIYALDTRNCLNCDTIDDFLQG